MGSNWKESKAHLPLTVLSVGFIFVSRDKMKRCNQDNPGKGTNMTCSVMPHLHLSNSQEYIGKWMKIHWRYWPSHAWSTEWPAQPQWSHSIKIYTLAITSSEKIRVYSLLPISLPGKPVGDHCMMQQHNPIGDPEMVPFGDHKMVPLGDHIMVAL